jgi:ribosomal protein S6--L-glutamate ligase
MFNGWLRLAAAGTPLRPTAAHVVSGYSEGAVIKRIEGTVVSFHPLFRADFNLICAGRDPGHIELAAIRNADAVILPQGCPQPLYQMARENCRHVFPNYDARFRYPGKIGQIRLFRETDTPHPETEIFRNSSDFRTRYPGDGYPAFPVVFKFDWGGEGDTVFLLQTPADLKDLLQHTERCESSGQSGFLLQQYILSGNRSLRVAVIGERSISYWRGHAEEDRFYASVSKGAKVDLTSDPVLKQKAEELVADFCRRTLINLAGLDVIIAEEDPRKPPLLLEINYFFGRVGLGGSETYYRILRKEIRRWLKCVGV